MLPIMSDDLDSWKDKQFSRREFLKLLGAGSLALGVGFFGVSNVLKIIREASATTEAGPPVLHGPNNNIMLGIFYYPWYGGKDNKEVPYRHWKNGGHNPPLNWNSRYLPNISGSTVTEPAMRLYDSHNQTIVKRQMNLINDAHINFVIWSWWGQNSFSDHSLTYFWKSGNNPPGLKHCIYYEKEYLDNVPQNDIISDINYIKSKYAGSSKYLKINDKPAVFVYNSTPDQTLTDPNYQINLSKKWSAVRGETNIYSILKVFRGWQDYKSNASSWHQYAPSTPYAKVAGSYSSFVSPGWWSPTEDTPRLARDITRFTDNIKTMKSDGCPLHTIQTWNEWTEGTGIEPATFTATGQDHGNTYINIIAKYF
jgi:hypothetical protein